MGSRIPSEARAELDRITSRPDGTAVVANLSLPEQAVAIRGVAERFQLSLELRQRSSSLAQTAPGAYPVERWRLNKK